jgi:hypothetical protein
MAQWLNGNKKIGFHNFSLKRMIRRKTLQKLKKNVFLQPEKGCVANPDNYRENRTAGFNNFLLKILVP